MAYYPQNSPHWQQDQSRQKPHRTPRPRTNGPRRRLSKRATIALSVVAAIAIFYALSLSFGVKTPAYVKGETTLNFARNGQLGPAYSVVVSQPCTDEELIQVYRDVTRNDGYAIHAVGIWSSAELMLNGWGVDVAMIMDDSGSPIVTRY